MFNRSVVGAGGLGIRIVFYCQFYYSKLSVRLVIVNIALDKKCFSIKRYRYFSQFLYENI